MRIVHKVTPGLDRPQADVGRRWVLSVTSGVMRPGRVQSNRLRLFRVWHLNGGRAWCA